MNYLRCLTRPKNFNDNSFISEIMTEKVKMTLECLKEKKESINRNNFRKTTQPFISYNNKKRCKNSYLKLVSSGSKGRKTLFNNLFGEMNIKKRYKSFMK